MLDKRTGALLFQINTLCKESGYRIIEEKELLCASSEEELPRALAYLKEHGYIDIRYGEEGVYCLMPLPEGRLYFESVLKERTAAEKRLLYTLLFTALGALLGSFFGALAACLIFL